ncbi:MAG: efflux RND transporter permease subunit [Acidobacteriaceae bacterium]
MKRFAPATRYALLSCFVLETQSTLLDHPVQMHDQFLTTMCRKSRHAFEERHRDFRRRAKKGVETLLSAFDILLLPGNNTMSISTVVYEKIGEASVRDALADCREFQRLEEAGYQNELRTRYGSLRRYLLILMTALVTALGLLPLTIGSGSPGQEIEGPLAIVILGGLITSTALNLLVLLILALRFDRFQKRSYAG